MIFTFSFAWSQQDSRLWQDETDQEAQSDKIFVTEDIL